MGPVPEAGHTRDAHDGSGMVEFLAGDVSCWSNGRHSASSQRCLVPGLGHCVYGACTLLNLHHF